MDSENELLIYLAYSVIQHIFQHVSIWSAHRAQIYQALLKIYKCYKMKTNNKTIIVAYATL